MKNEGEKKTTTIKEWLATILSRTPKKDEEWREEDTVHRDMLYKTTSVY